MDLRFAGILLLGVMAAACQRSTPDGGGRVLAEVGSTRLTLEMAREAIPYAVWESDSTMAIQRYVDSWVSRTLMSREADRLGLWQLEDVDRRLKRMRDDLLIEVLRERALNELSTEIEVTEDEIEAYYLQNQSQFELSERHVRVRHLMTETLEKAMAAKRDLASGLPWERVVAQYASDRDAALASDAELKPVSAQLLDVQPMRAYLTGLPLNAASAVRQHEGLFHFVEITESYPAGSIPDIDWVKDRIFEWLLIDKKRRALQQFERSLFYEAESQGSLRIHPYP